MKKIAIICRLDGFANSVFPKKIKQFFEERNYQVTLVNTHYISRFKPSNDVASVVPATKFELIAIYILEILDYFTKKYIFGGKHNYYIFLKTIQFRAHILKQFFLKNDFDITICESLSDAYYILNPVKKVVIYHCATPHAEELYMGKELSYKDYTKYKKLEMEIFSHAQYLAFHWETYANYVAEKYGYNLKNLFICNWGTETNKVCAQFSEDLKVVYFGYLGGYWINPNLIATLSEKYRKIDVYGFPPPKDELKLNYKGYAQPDIVGKYQFGLITVTKDPLRKQGFSAKHLEYMSYGLPVLVPEWRNDPILDPYSIKFNEDNFLDILKKYKDNKKWAHYSKKMIEGAKKFNWDISMKNIERILKTYNV